MVVDAVIRHWVKGVYGEDMGPEGFGRAVQKLVALFYENNVCLVSARPLRLQEALGVMTNLLYRLVLCKTVDVVL